jgi:IS5 family transposase
MTLAHRAEFQRYSKRTRREQFLEEMDAMMPWSELLTLAGPHYSKGEMGRKPVGLEIMLRVYFLQQWFALSDPGVEDALYESPMLRRFAGIDLGRAPVRVALCADFASANIYQHRRRLARANLRTAPIGA